MKRVLLLVNPKSRQGHTKLEEIRISLALRGHTIVNESELEVETDFCRSLRTHRDMTDVVLVAGGDGSVNAILPELLISPLPLLVIPVGTANNLARTLQLPTTTNEILDLIDKGTLKKIDVGHANGIPFVNLIGLGLSTQVNRLVQPGLKRWIGSLAFFPTALKVALRMNPFRAVILCDGKTHHARTWQITVCNGRNYGSGLTIDDAATLTDGTLHGLSTEVAKWWHAFFMAPAFLSGRFRRSHQVRRFQGNEIRIETRRPMRVDVDGDIKTKTPLQITVQTAALEVFIPRRNP